MSERLQFYVVKEPDSVVANTFLYRLVYMTPIVAPPSGTPIGDVYYNMIGTFSSQSTAQKVADAMNDAYPTGW